MTKFIITSFTLFFLCIHGSLVAQKILDEATISWAVTDAGATTDQGAQRVEMLKSLETTFTFNAHHFAGHTQMGNMMTSKYYYDKNQDSRKFFLTMMGKKYHANLNPAEFSKLISGIQNFSDQTFTLNPNNPRIILGYACQSATGIIDQQGQKGTVTIYFTEDLSFKGQYAENFQSQIVDEKNQPIKGTVLRIESDFSSFRFTMEIIELKEKLDPELLKEPKLSEYSAMEPALLKQFIQQ